MSTQILIRLSDEIAERLKAVIPARKRNQFVVQLVEKALVDREHELGKIADAVTTEERESKPIQDELAAWERSTIVDGLDESK